MVVLALFERNDTLASLVTRLESPAHGFEPDGGVAFHKMLLCFINK